MAHRANSDDIVERQEYILDCIKNNTCSISCAAALSDDNCHCRCGGLNHGGLWVDLVVVSYEEAS